jgi:hypothetical protein
MNVPHMDVPENIRSFHELFEKLSGARFTLDYCRMDAWRQFINYRRHEPYTHDDLRLVWRHLRKQILNGKRNAGALKFRNIIQNPDYFEEDLIEAQGEAERASKPPQPKTQVVTYGNTTRVIEADNTQHNAVSIQEFFSKLKSHINGNQPSA